MEKEKQYGTLWLRFYIKVRFLIILILTPIYLFQVHSQAREIQYYNPTVWNLSIVFIIVEIAIFFFRLTVYQEMRSLLPAGYKHNDTLLLLETFLVCPLNAGIASSINYGVWGVTYILSIFIYFLLWYLPNSVYFKKRQFLFNGEWSLKTLPKKVSQGATAIIQPQQYKQKRNSASEGQELIPDSIAHQQNTQNEHIALERATLEEQSEQSEAEKQPANNQSADDSISSSSSTNNSDNQENTVKIKLKKANNSLHLNSKRCIKCGAVLEEDARYCSACGQKVESKPTAPKYCRFCGSKLETEFKYCNKCGHKIGGQFDEV